MKELFLSKQSIPTREFCLDDWLGSGAGSTGSGGGIYGAGSGVAQLSEVDEIGGISGMGSGSGAEAGKCSGWGLGGGDGYGWAPCWTFDGRGAR